MSVCINVRRSSWLVLRRSLLVRTPLWLWWVSVDMTLKMLSSWTRLHLTEALFTVTSS